MSIYEVPVSRKEKLQQQITQLQAELAKYQQCEENAESLKQEVAIQAQLMLELEWKQSEIVEWGDRLYFLITGIDLREQRNLLAQNDSATVEVLQKENTTLVVKVQELESKIDELSAMQSADIAKIEELEARLQPQPIPKFTKGDRVTTNTGEEGEVTGFAYGNAIVKLIGGEFQFKGDRLTKVESTQQIPTNPDAETQKRGEEFMAGIKKQSDVKAIAWEQIKAVCQNDKTVLSEIGLNARTTIQKSLLDKIPSLLASYIEVSGDRSDLDWVGDTLKAKVEELLAPKQEVA